MIDVRAVWLRPTFGGPSLQWSYTLVLDHEGYPPSLTVIEPDKWPEEGARMMAPWVREAERRALRLAGGRSERDIEYDFAYRSVTGRQSRILDVGGCDSLLPLVLCKDGHRVTVYDFRPYAGRHPNLSVIQSDFLRNTLPAGSFEVVLMISTIEHIGLGAYGAPVLQDGDFRAINQARRLLVDGGKLVLTFPFNQEERLFTSFERWYSADRVGRLTQRWRHRDEEFWVPDKKLLGRWVRWRPATMEAAGQASVTTGMHGLACLALSPE